MTANPAIFEKAIVESDEYDAELARLIEAGRTPMEIYVRSAQVAGALVLGTALLPIVAKWLLVGRWKPTEFPIWSLRYFRFWLVKTLIRTNPLVRLVGTPLYPFYLRLLGAALPVSIGLGTLLAFVLDSSSGIWLALLVGAALAPTDAALGASMMGVIERR